MRLPQFIDRALIATLFLLTGRDMAGAQDFALKATVVTPNTVIDSAVLTVKGGKIQSVDSAGAGAAIAVDGVIFPGLIDLHNHMTWNVLPNWKPPRLFTNRYEWQETPEYALHLSGVYNAMIGAGAACDMNRFGEVKSLINGGTTTVGSYGPSADDPNRNRCILGLARNADFAAEVASPPTLNQEPYRNFVFPFELSNADEQSIRAVDPSSTDGTKLHAAIVHLAEGTDAAARREFRMFRSHQFIRKGVSVIHGVALAPDQIRELARGGVGFVWSPHSNFILYGKTADILTALDARMTVALAPDWSPTGSAGMLEEIGVAYRYSQGALGGAITDAALVQMATINPARLAGLDGTLGSIEAGKLADLVIMRRHGANAYQALLSANPADVLLVTVAGVPLYGDPALMSQLLPMATLEDVTICGERKSLHIVNAVPSDQSWAAVTRRLTELMRQIGFAPAALATCGVE